MSNANGRTPALRLVALCGWLLTAVPALAQTGDPLKEAADRREIARQQLEVQVNDAIRRADAVGRAQPDAALRYLQDALTAVEADQTGLSAEQRDTLVRK